MVFISPTYVLSLKRAVRRPSLPLGCGNLFCTRKEKRRLPNRHISLSFWRKRRGPERERERERARAGVLFFENSAPREEASPLYAHTRLDTRKERRVCRAAGSGCRASAAWGSAPDHSTRSHVPARSVAFQYTLDRPRLTPSLPLSKTNENPKSILSFAAWARRPGAA